MSFDVDTSIPGNRACCIFDDFPVLLAHYIKVSIQLSFVFAVEITKTLWSIRGYLAGEERIERIAKPSIVLRVPGSRDGQRNQGIADAVLQCVGETCSSEAFDQIHHGDKNQ